MIVIPHGDEEFKKVVSPKMDHYDPNLRSSAATLFIQQRVEQEQQGLRRRRAFEGTTG